MFEIALTCPLKTYWKKCSKWFSKQLNITRVFLHLPVMEVVEKNVALFSKNSC